MIYLSSRFFAPLIALSVIGGYSHIAHGQTVVRSNTANGEIRLTVNNDSEGQVIGTTLSTANFHSTSPSSVGSGGSTPNRRTANIVYFFQIPTLAPGEMIGSASLSLALVDRRLDLQGGEPFEPNLDVYGVGFQVSPSRQTSWFYQGPNDPAATLIQAGFATSGSPLERTETSAAGDVNLAVFLNSLYAEGATGGEYAVIRLNLSEDFNPNSSITRYQLQGSRADENPANDAYLTYTVIPEPATAGLLLGGAILLSLVVLRRRRS